MVVTVDERVPDPDREKDAIRRESMERALTYMGLEPNTPMTDIRIDKVFIGSHDHTPHQERRGRVALVRRRPRAPHVGGARGGAGAGPGAAQAAAEGRVGRVSGAGAG